MQSAEPKARRTLARSALHHWHVNHSGRIGESDGWEIPLAYSNDEQERAAIRDGVALVDLSPLAKVRLTGRVASSAVVRLSSASTTQRPGVVSNLDGDSKALVCQLTNEQLLVLGSTGDVASLLEHVASATANLAIERQDASYALAGIHVVGPKGDDLLRRVAAVDLADRVFPAGSCMETSSVGIHAVIVRDPALTVAAVRVYVAWDLGEYLWERFLEAGRDLGAIAAGHTAWRACLGERPV
jgi:heterotetrameric sarcosine oxidase gamma subunit